jgi:hypothetical protein
VVPVLPDTSLLDRLPLAGDVLPRLSPAQQATVTAEISDAILQALDAILDPGQDGYHDTNGRPARTRRASGKHPIERVERPDHWIGCDADGVGDKDGVSGGRVG